MTLKVHDFYTKEKLSTNRYHNILMSSTLFYILISDGCGEFKEFSITIPKRYHYERTVNYGDFEVGKANEYNVLIDYIKHNECALEEKWHLTNIEYHELIEGLEKVLIQRYATCCDFTKLILFAGVCLKVLVKKISRRIKKCQGC